jgi:hypothetical protein
MSAVSFSAVDNESFRFDVPAVPALRHDRSLPNARYFAE